MYIISMAFHIIIPSWTSNFFLSTHFEKKNSVIKSLIKLSVIAVCVHIFFSSFLVLFKRAWVWMYPWLLVFVKMIPFQIYVLTRIFKIWCTSITFFPIKRMKVTLPVGSYKYNLLLTCWQKRNILQTLQISVFIHYFLFFISIISEQKDIVKQ